jgi:hypothetical protein
MSEIGYFCPPPQKVKLPNLVAVTFVNRFERVADYI